MMKKNVRCLIGIFMAVAMLCGLNGCSNANDNGDDGQVVIEVEDKQVTYGETGQATSSEESQETEKAASGEKGEKAEKAASDEKSEKAERVASGEKTEKESSGEDLDKVVPSAADDDWYVKGNIYTDDKGNRLEVFFNDYGTLEFAVNGRSLYFTTVDNFQQENNWKVYTCDDNTMIGYYPGEPAHLEICDGEYAGLYEAGGDKMN
ncbi:MAG: hypothetical protein K2N34_02175 [Lachnospiraceae bacterium]|nr:hypothetical protein [Lachnospiraceae bacterium]